MSKNYVPRVPYYPENEPTNRAMYGEARRLASLPYWLVIAVWSVAGEVAIKLGIFAGILYVLAKISG